MNKSAEIGGVRVDAPIWLAPLAGISTYSFRAFHRKIGAGLVHTEMVSAAGLAWKNEKTYEMLGGFQEPGPIVLQLFAPNAKTLMAGVSACLSKPTTSAGGSTRAERGIGDFDALEINMACPMPKVAKKGAGAKLLERPDLAAEMVTALKELGRPVWVKMRIIPTAKHLPATNAFCETMLSAGADLLLLHGRTPAQRYEGASDKGTVCRIAGEFRNRVVASGDFYSPDDALVYLRGGCVGVLAARGVLQDVFLIPKTLAALGRTVPRRFLVPSVPDRIDAVIEMGRSGMTHEGERFTLVLTKRMLSGLFKGFPGAAALRQSCAVCRDWRAFEALLTEQKELFLRKRSCYN